jgi:hypothetical protein
MIEYDLDTEHSILLVHPNFWCIRSPHWTEATSVNLRGRLTHRSRQRDGGPGEAAQSEPIGYS